MADTREFHYSWDWLLPLSADALWPLVSDTNRFNRDAGLPPVEEVGGPAERLPNARRRLRLKVKGIMLEWEELPFEWYKPYRFGVIRRYSKGPLLEMRVRVDLHEEGVGVTRIRYHVAARPRGLLGMVTTPIQIGLLSRRTFGRVFRRYAEALKARSHTGVPTPSVDRATRRRIDRARDELSAAGVTEAMADRLVEHLHESDDLTLARMRPYDLADQWGAERKDVLRACLLATRAGVLDLSWDILCPVCRGPQDSANTLQNLRTGLAHCDTCQIDFSPDFDQVVEISFSPSPAVRTVTAPPFCVAGPQITPDVEVQQLLASGEARTVSAVLGEGRHRVRAFGVPGGPTFHVREGGAEEAEFRLRADREWSTSAQEAVDPHARLTLANEGPEEVLIDVERPRWADSAATAAEVTAMADFRDLFASEVLAAGDFVSVGTLAVLFTDLKASTRLYQQIGDAPAFSRVMRHFDVLRDAVAAEGGAVVKTIGDAVMAVFVQPASAVRAALASQARLAEGEDALVLKAGVHLGPCIAVTLNDRLDYFGSTVNVASRLGSLSSGNDLVISKRVRRHPEVEALFREMGATVTSTRAQIQGMDERLEVWRVVAPGGTESAVRTPPAGS